MLEDQDSNRPGELFLDSRNHKGPSFVDPRFMICSGIQGYNSGSSNGSRSTVAQCLQFAMPTI